MFKRGDVVKLADGCQIEDEDGRVLNWRGPLVVDYVMPSGRALVVREGDGDLWEVQPEQVVPMTEASRLEVAAREALEILQHPMIAGSEIVMRVREKLRAALERSEP